MSIEILQIGPGVTWQDQGRFGLISQGISPGGALDQRALLEAQALFGHARPAIECPLSGITLRVKQACQIALTGALRHCKINQKTVRAGGSFPLNADDILTVSAGIGVFYISFDADVVVPIILGSVSTNVAAGIGRHIQAGDIFAMTPREIGPAKILPPRTPVSHIRVMPGPQTMEFDAQTRDRFEQTVFKAGQFNRQGVRLEHDGNGFQADGQLHRVSDFIISGDIQMIGKGVPYVLTADFQTIGGYPRIGTVVPQDLPFVIQATEPLRFQFVEGVQIEPRQALIAKLQAGIKPLVRAPQDVNLSAFNLISGAITGQEDAL